MTAPGLRIATWNVNGIRARQAQFVEWVARDQPDVVCLQEIKVSHAQLAPELLDLPGYHSRWHESVKGYSGVSLHLLRERFPEPPVFSHPAFDLESRLVAATVGDQVFESVYVPNGGKDYDAKMVFLRALVGHVRDLHAAGKSLILCGDMNVARAEVDVHPKLRDNRAIGQRPEERELMEALVTTAGLIDVGRALAPDNDHLFTWWPYWRDHRGRNIGWRLDYVFATAARLEPVTCRILSEIGTSDHAPVLAEVSARRP